MKRICFLLLAFLLYTTHLQAAGWGTTYQKTANDGWWASYRNSTDVVTPDSAIVEVVKAASADHNYRITKLTMNMWYADPPTVSTLSTTWELILNDGVNGDSVVAVGGCANVADYNFNTPIPVPLNTTVKIKYTLITDSTDCKLWYTVYGDEQ